VRDGGAVKLVLASGGATFGTPERVVWELATRLSPSRFRVSVWLAASPGADELAESLAGRGVTVARLPAIGSRWDWRGMARVWMTLGRHDPDLLHVHHGHPGADPWLPAFVRWAGVANLVVTEHGAEHGHAPPRRRAKRGELEGADAVTVSCRALADELTDEYQLDRGRMQVVPYGADPPDEADEWPAARRLRDEFGAGQFRPLWVAAGRLEEHKGHAVLLDTLAALRARNRDFVAVLAGEGPLREPLERRAERLGLGRSLRFAGAAEALGPLLLAADAVVLPSLRETVPLTLLEALARGRPVIASRVGGVPELIEDGITGRLVPPGDAGALAGALDELHHRPGDAVHMGRAAAARMRAEFTWSRTVERFEAVYDDVLGLATFAPETGGRSGARR
jgi:glycosyltransferase involved in cell wall biosynthesis